VAAYLCNMSHKHAVLVAPVPPRNLHAAWLEQVATCQLACHLASMAGSHASLTWSRAALLTCRGEVPGAVIDTWRLDLADLSSVRAAAAQWLDSGRPLDVLINNAGGRRQRGQQCDVLQQEHLCKLSVPTVRHSCWLQWQLTPVVKAMVGG
jgi:NAD(P)-dependent dehydrogenase (short-subunit alcohol dehydrogenase family)